MSCIFCGHNYHLSQNCDCYVTNEERWEILRLKDCCRNCLTILQKGNGQNTETSFRCCKSKKKCYVCFSKDHHTVYCPYQIRASKLFPPNIDKDLLTRFMQLFTVDEKYLLFLSSPTIFKSNKIIATKLNNVPKNKVSKVSNLIVINDLCVEDYYRCCIIPPLERFSTPPVFRDQNFQIQCSAYPFLRLLTPKMKHLVCTNMKFIPKITFAEILQEAPNMEVIDFAGTNIEVGNTWLDDLLHFHQGEKLKQLRLSVDELNFSVAKLATFIKDKSIDATLYINHPWGEPYDKKKSLEMIKEKLSSHFVLAESDFYKSLQIVIKNVFLRNYKLKDT